MATLKDSVVSGSLRVTDTLYSTTAQFQILRAPTSSNGTTYGPGTNGNFLKSNGTSVYWVSLAAADIPNISTDKLTSGTLPVGRGGTGQTSIANIQAGKDGDGNTISSTYLKLSGGTLTGNLIISHATNATMTADSTNPKITFSESGSQPVHLIYTDYDNYRNPAGLKVIGGANANPAWFEVEGQIYTSGGTFKNIATSSNTSLYVQTNQNNGGIELRADGEGGNLKITGPNGTSYFEIDASNNTHLRVYSYSDFSDTSTYKTINWDRTSGNLLNNNGIIYAGNTSLTKEIQLRARSAAGEIYLFTQGSTTGSKGLYSYNASGIEGGILTINQSNQISSLADINTNVNITNGGVKIKSIYNYSDLPSTGSLNTSLLYMSDNTSAAYHNVYSSLSSTGTKTFYIMTREPGDELKTYVQFGIKLDSDGSPGFSLSAKNNGESTNAAAQAAFRSTIAAVAKAGDTMTGGLIVSLAKGTEDHFIARATGYTNSAKLDVSLEIGNGKTNHGIYSTGYSTDGNAFTSDPKWMIYRNNAGTIIVNGNCTGTSANVTGTVAINNGGTGRTSWGVNQVVITDANGALSQTASVPVTRGGTGTTTATAYPGLRNLGLKIKKVTTGWTSNTNGNIDLGISGNRYQVLCVYDDSAGYVYIPYLASNSKWSAHVLSNTGAVQKSVGVSGTWWCLYLDYGSAPAAT